MSRSYLAKLLVMIIGLVLALQLVSLMTARSVIRDTVLQNAQREIQVGSTLFTQLMFERELRLQESVRNLANNDQFIKAFASGETTRINAALAEFKASHQSSYSALIDSRLVRPAGGVETTETFPYPQLLKQAQGKSIALNTVAIDGQSYQLVAASIKGPSLIGWVVIGFTIDQSWAENLKTLTGLDVSFIWADVEPITTLDLKSASELSSFMASPDSLSLTELFTTQSFSVEQIMSMTVPQGGRGETFSTVLHLPMARLLVPYDRLNNQLLGLTVTGGLIAALIAGFFAFRLTRSVSNLARASQRIADGDYNTELSVVSDDELGHLARAFNQMQLAIAEREDHIQYQSKYDHLTGLPNRFYAMKKLEKVIRKAQLDNTRMSVIVIDLKRFKAINDSFGYKVGDYVLQAVAKRLQALVKAQDTVVRLNADEFMVILCVGGDEQAQLVAGHLAHQLAKPIDFQGMQIILEVNIGIASYTADTNTPQQLIRRADLAKIAAQQSVSHIAVYQEGEDELHLRQLKLLQGFNNALLNNEMHLYYQPKVGLKDASDIGVEVMVRWLHPEYGYIQPDDFVPLVENSGNISHLTHWVLNEAIAELGRWIANGYKLNLSVNISVLDLLHSDFPVYLAHLLKRDAVPAESLCLEITESSIMKETELGMIMLQRLKSMGILLSIDDFGTGFSSLSQLKKLPFDELKIDKSFILNLDKNEDDHVIVHSTIELGHNMGLKVVAEGVENDEAKRLLTELGCDMIQGYVLAKPMPLSDFSRWLSTYPAKNISANKPKTNQTASR